MLPDIRCEDHWGISSAGRAPALQAGGRRFDPDKLHHSLRMVWTGISRKKVHALRPRPSGFGSPVLTHCEEKTGPEGSTGRKADRSCPGRIARGFIARWSNVPRHTRRLGLRAVASPINMPDRCCRVPSLEAGLSSVLVLQGTRADRAPSQDADPRCTRAGVEGAQKNEAVLFVSLTLALRRRFDEHGR